MVRPPASATPNKTLRRWPLALGWALVICWLAVIVLAVSSTWTYQTGHAGELDGLETLYVQTLGLPWIWLPLGWHTGSAHGFTAVAATFDLLNWAIGSALILFVANRVAASARPHGGG